MKILHLLAWWPLRLVVPIVLLMFTLGSWVVVYALHMADLRQRAISDLVNDLGERIQLQAKRIESLDELGNDVGLERLVGRLAVYRQVTHAWLIDGDDRVLASLRRSELQRPLAQVAQGLPEDQATTLQASLAQSDRRLLVQRIDDGLQVLGSQPLRLGDARVGSHRLLVLADAAPFLQRAEADYLRTFRISVAVSALLAMVLWGLLRFQWLGRAERLHRAAASLQLDTYTPARLEGRDELAALGRAFDDTAARLGKQARLIRLLSNINQRIARDRRPETALPAVCELVVELGGYGFAAVALLQADGHRLQTIAQAGMPAAEGFPPAADLDDPRQDTRPLVRAMRSGQVVIEDDLAALRDPPEAVSLLRNYGIRSLVVAPLIAASGARGALMIGDRQPRRFDADYVDVVRSLASDIAVALDLDWRERAQRQAEHRLAVSLQAAELDPWEYDPAAQRLRIGPRLRALLRPDAAADELGREAWLQCIHEDDRARWTQALEDCLATPERPFEVELRLRDGDRGNDEWRWIQARGTVVERGGDGRAQRMAGVHGDIGARKQAEAQLRIASELFEHSQEGVLVCAADTTILAVNPAFQRLTGYSAAEAIGRTPALLHSGRHDGEFYAAMWYALQRNGYWEGEIWNRRKNGELYAEWLRLTRLLTADGQVLHYIGQFTDVSERKDFESRLAFLSDHDPLTGLPNRQGIACAIDALLARGETVALLYADIDRFAQINESFGYAAGDGVLAEVARRLREALPEGALLSRLTGDEFLIAVADGDAQYAHELGVRLVAQIAAPILLESAAVSLGASLGVALAPAHGNDAGAAISAGKLAVDAAKGAGRGTVTLYRPEFNQSGAQRLLLESELRQALQRNELFVVYQPQVDLARGHLIGIEALVRWRHPQRGELAPGLFIAVAEETGLIAAVGEFVLREACRAAVRLQRAGLPAVPMSVNVSALQFRRDDFLATVQRALVDSGLPAARLELELTESILMSGADGALEMLRDLRQLGVRLAIDDFGTGYSSLAYLGRMAMDRLKIDQAFVRDMRHSASAAGIVRAIIALARGLRLGVLAEGVELAEDAERLRALGCDDAQGYWFGRPMDETALPATVRQLGSDGRPG